MTHIFTISARGVPHTEFVVCGPPGRRALEYMHARNPGLPARCASSPGLTVFGPRTARTCPWPCTCTCTWPCTCCTGM